jgi:curved DNA-binding protein CbpA
MKNYYRILGVKKDASEEEIREHWVKFMRKLHPDQRMEGAVEGERIKEINEAYQVLKHSSTRLEYDLKMAYDQGKSGSYFRKLSMPVSILIVLVILGTVYLKKTQITIQPALVTQDKINQTNQKNQIDQKNQANQTNQINEINQINLSRLPRSESVRGEMQSLFHRDQMNQINPIASTTRKPKRSNVHNYNNVLNDLTINTSTHPRIDHTIVSTDQQPERSNVLNGNNDPNDLTIRASTQRRDDPVAVFNQTNQINQIDQIDQTNQTAQIDASTHPRIDGATHQPIDLAIVSATQQSKRSNVLNDNNDLNVIRTSASTPLIATEDEVRHFFANYTERYTQKDLDGFLSLFSPRAVQNRQDGLEGIRKIYGNFFKLCQEIEYHMNDFRIEIYQNGVEVKARYELVQVFKKGGDKKIQRGNIRWTLVKEHEALKILFLDYQHQKPP